MKKKITLFICIICILGIGVWCFNQFNNQVVKVGVSHDYLMVDTLDNANKNAQYIVKGYFTAYDKEWNMWRDDNDLSKEHPSEKMTGKIYNFKINDVFKGNVDKSDISVNFKYSTRLFFNEDGLLHGTEILSNKDAEYIDYKDTAYIEPELNKEYILYLNYDKNFSLYYAAFQPYIIKVDQNQLSIQSNLVSSDTMTTNTYQAQSRKIEVQEEQEKAKDFVKGISLEEFINKINR